MQKVRRRRSSLPDALKLPEQIALQRQQLLVVPQLPSTEKLPKRYQVLKAIGEGAYGFVYEACDEALGRHVAVKRITNVFRDTVDCKRILREIAIMSRLDHPCIVQLLDVAPVNNVSSFDEIMLVMELCDTDFARLCRAGISLSELQIKTLFYNLLLGLRYLHTSGVCHRDLKPANCLANADCSVKICDFGLARALGEEWTEAAAERLQLPEASEEAPKARAHRRASRRLSNHVATRWYRAPELILLQENYTQAVDVWSVGCIYVELLGMLDNMRPEDRMPLFPGQTCFPLSPNSSRTTDHDFHIHKASEQLNLIFDLLGTPSEKEREAFSGHARRYLNCFAPRKGVGLETRLPQASSDDVTLVEEALRFDASSRITIKQLLQHEALAAVRDTAVENEAKASSTIELDFERKEADQYPTGSAD
jgi:mitogen-activated protein kinase 1/3